MKLIVVVVLLMVSLRVCLADESFKLNFWDDACKMEKVTTPLQSQYFGVFSHVMDFTGGKKIYLFPDAGFVISHSCDICQEETKSYGKFEIVDSVLKLDYEFKSEKETEEYFVRYGVSLSNDPRSRPIKVVFSKEQLKAAKENPDAFDFYIQEVQFYDWEATQKKLRNAIH